MADPRAEARSLSIAPPPPAPVPVEDPPTVDPEPEAKVEAAPVKEPTPRAQPPAPTDAPPPSAAAAPETPAAEPAQRTGERRTRRKTSKGSPTAVPRRDKATTLYLAEELRDLLAKERQARGVSQADLVLDAVRRNYQSVADQQPTTAPAPDPLGLPAPRRPRRRVEGGGGVQFRFTVEEHAALERLAGQIGIPMSEMVSACLEADD